MSNPHQVINDGLLSTLCSYLSEEIEQREENVAKESDEEIEENIQDLLKSLGVIDNTGTDENDNDKNLITRPFDSSLYRVSVSQPYTTLVKENDKYKDVLLSSLQGDGDL